jgi:hypothetical protein
MTQRAKLRVCGRCSWIFEGETDCPKCGFGSYGARWVLGKVCCRYRITQQPWLHRQMDKRARELLDEILTSNGGSNDVQAT